MTPCRLSITSHPKTDEMRLKSGLAGLAYLKRVKSSRFPDLQLVCSDSADKFDIGFDSLLRAVGVDLRYEDWPLVEGRYIRIFHFISGNDPT